MDGKDIDEDQIGSQTMEIEINSHKRKAAEDKRLAIKEKLAMALKIQKAAVQFLKNTDEDESLREHLLTEAAEASGDEESELGYVPSIEYILTDASEVRRNQEPELEDVLSGEHLPTEAAEARTNQEPKLEDVSSTEHLLTEASEARRNQGPELEDVPSGEHLLTKDAEARTNQEPKLEYVSSREHLRTQAAEAGRNQESVDDFGSTVNSQNASKLLGKYKKRTLALFYVLLEAASFSLDIIGKMKWRILLDAFVLSAVGFAISMYTCIMRRTRAATRVHWRTQLVWMVEISFSVVQLVVTLVNFLLAEVGVKNKFDASVLPLVFAVIVAAFNIIYVREVSDSSGLASSLMSPAADRQLQDLQENAISEGVLANGSLSIASVADHQLQNIQVHKPNLVAKDAEANRSLSMAPAAGLHAWNVRI